MTYSSRSSACVWHRDELSPAIMPAYPIRQAMLAPTLAIEAKKMNALGTVLSRLKAAYVTKMERTPIRLREAPILSVYSMVSRWATVRFM